MADIRLGDSRLSFGVTDEVWGYVQNIKDDIGSKTAEAQNGAGSIVAAEIYCVGDRKITGSYFFKTDQTTGPWSRVGSLTGCAITDITGTTIITRAGKARASGTWTVIDFEGVLYANLVMS